MRFPWSDQSRRVMSATPREFVTCLQTAFPGAVTPGEGHLLLQRDSVCLRFDYTVSAPRRIGLLELPQMTLVITRLAGDAAAGAALLDAVDRATQRGGG